MKKDKDDIFYKLWQQRKELKREKKSKQIECLHKKNDTTCLLRKIEGGTSQFVVRCKRCHEKVDLSIYDARNGSPIEQLKNARRIFRSAFNATKLLSNPKKDKDILGVSIKGAKMVESQYLILKQLLSYTDKKKNKKQHGSKFNVAHGGRSLF